MRIHLPVLMLTSILFFASCKKDEASERACWQILDPSGQKLNQICDKTEREMIDCVESGSCGIYNYTPGSLTNCYYFKVEGDEHCWVRSDGSYMQHIIDNEADLQTRCYSSSTSLIKVDCNQCERWYNREKQTYKPTGSIHYSTIRLRYYWTDSLATLYPGREVIRKDDADSLIVIQFSNDGVNW